MIEKEVYITYKDIKSYDSLKVQIKRSNVFCRF